MCVCMWGKMERGELGLQLRVGSLQSRPTTLQSAVGCVQWSQSISPILALSLDPGGEARHQFEWSTGKDSIQHKKPDLSPDRVRGIQSVSLYQL